MVGYIKNPTLDVPPYHLCKECENSNICEVNTVIANITILHL